LKTKNTVQEEDSLSSSIIGRNSTYPCCSWEWISIPEFRPVKARDLLVQKANLFVGKKDEFLAVSIPDIYMKKSKVTTGKNGKQYYQHVFIPIAAIAICRLPKDVEERTT